jgi:uncharacterized protein (TIRG00374 family)
MKSIISKLRLNKGIRLLLTFAFIWFIYTKIDLSNLFSTIKKANYWLILLALGVFVFNRILISLRWKVILSAYDIPATLLNVIKIIFVSMPAGFLTPGGAGTDLARGYQVSKQHGQTADVAGSIIIDRIIGLYSMFFVAFIAIYISPPIEYMYEMRMILTVSILLLTVGGLVGLYILRVYGSRVNISFSKKLNAQLSKLINALADFSVLKKIFMPIAIISLLVQFCRCVVFYFLFLSLGVQLDFIYFLVLVPLVFVLLFMPISLGGLGVRETSLLFFFAQFGVASEVSVSAGLLGYGLEMLMLLVGILIFLIGKKDAGQSSHAGQDRS